MVETKYRLDESRSTTLSSGGGKTIRSIGPTRPGERWHVKLITVSTTGNNQGNFTVYRGEVSPTNQVDYTEKVTGDTSATDIPLMPGEFITVQWLGCAPSATGTVHFIGDYYVPGNRSY